MIAAGKLPPCDIDAEKMVLGSILRDFDDEVKADVFDTLKTDMFYDHSHRIVYAAMLSLYHSDLTFDIVNLYQTIKKTGRQEEIGGTDYIGELGDSVPSSANARCYAQQVRELWQRREIIRRTDGLREIAETTSEPLAAVESAAENLLNVFSNNVRTESTTNIIKQILDELDDPPKPMVQTGFGQLDKLLGGGFRECELIILAARPGMGKSALGFQIAENLSIVNHKPCLAVSLEMSEKSIIERLVYGRAGVSSWRHKLGHKLTNKQKDEITKISGEMSEAPIRFLDAAHGTIENIRIMAKRMQRQGGLSMIVIDHLGLMAKGGGGASLYEKITGLSRDIKLLAMELKIPILLLSQCNRASELRENHMLQLSDLRDSGAIEQDADIVLLLHREDYYHNSDKDYVKNKKAELVVAKQRNGPTGTLPFYYDGELVRFAEIGGAS